MARQAMETRDRLLEAACETFAAKGFRGATVADICRAAGANIAAVNYHFGDKETLYKESWRHAHRRMLEVFPPDGGAEPDAPAEQRLAGRIRSLLQRAMSVNGLEFRIMSHEMANPTGLLAEVIHDTIRPLAEGTERIVEELLDCGADRDTVRLCVMSIIGPCMQVMRRQRMQASMGQASWFSADKLEGMVEHFTAFALAGIREIKRRIEGGGHARLEPCGPKRQRGTK